MNTDIRLKTSFRDHRKRKKLQRALGAEGVLAFIDLMLMAAETRPDGILTGMDEIDVALDANWDGDPRELVDTLLSVGLLDTLEDGTYAIHDWREHNAYAASAEERSEAARKAAQARWGKRPAQEGNAEESQEQGPKNAELCGEQCATHADSMRPAQEGNAPSPSPSPSPNPSRKIRKPPEGGLSSLPLAAQDPCASERHPGVCEPDAQGAPAEQVSEVGNGSGNQSGEKRPKSERCPHESIVALYHELLPQLPKVQVWSGKRREALKTRWGEDKTRQDIAWWRAYFTRVAASDFLTGRTHGSKGPFVADLEWLVGAQNLVKVLNGRYDNRGPNTGSSRTDRNILTGQQWLEEQERAGF